MLAGEVVRLVDEANAVRRGGPLRRDAPAERALERAFTPSQRLAVYGTLAPGGCNHHLLADCPGPWVSGEVHGRRAVREFPVFSYDPRAARIAVHLLASPQLAGKWPALDAFETPAGYRRILVPVFAGGHLIAVANLYEAGDPVPPAGISGPA